MTGKLLCKLGWHNWDTTLYQDRSDPLLDYGHIRIDGGRRECNRCGRVQRLITSRACTSNKLCWEK